jgi:hypothetical protein
MASKSNAYPVGPLAMALIWLLVTPATSEGGNAPEMSLPALPQPTVGSLPPLPPIAVGNDAHLRLPKGLATRKTDHTKSKGDDSLDPYNAPLEAPRPSENVDLVTLNPRHSPLSAPGF